MPSPSDKLIHTHLIYPAVITLISPPCISVKLKKYGSDIKYLATVPAIVTECGIVLLTVNDDEFRDGVKPVEFENSPTLKDVVTIAEYLIRYDVTPVRSGVASRTEELLYVHGSTEHLGFQIDVDFLCFFES